MIEWNRYFSYVENREMPTVSSRIEWANDSRVNQLIQNKYIDSQLRAALTWYRDNCWVAPNQYKVEYTYSKYSHNESGRLFARKLIGLQGFPRDVRAYISGEYYIDIDQTNSNPRILDYLCQHYECENPNLQKYVESRDEVLKEVGTDKQGFMTQLLDSRAIPQHKFIQKIHKVLYNELVPILQKDNTYFKQLWEHVKDLRHTEIKGNRPGVFLALVSHTIESRILKTMTSYFEEHDFSVDSFQFDGELIRNNPGKEAADFLKDCEAVIQKKHNINMPLAIKPMIVNQKFFDEYHINPHLKDATESDKEDNGDDEEDTGIEDTTKAPYVMKIKPTEELSVAKAQSIYDNKKKRKMLIPYLNNFFAKITHESDPWYGTRDTREEPWITRKVNDVRESLKHVRINIWLHGKKKSTSLFKLWEWSTKMLTFKRLVMNPKVIGDTDFVELNLFRGFNAKKMYSYDPAVIQPILYHIK